MAALAVACRFAISFSQLVDGVVDKIDAAILQVICQASVEGTIEY